MDELNEMEADAIAGDFNIDPVAQNYIHVDPVPQPVPAAAQPAQAEEAKQMADLMAMMWNFQIVENAWRIYFALFSNFRSDTMHVIISSLSLP